MASKGYRVPVSVIVPVYKVEKYVKQCIDSILNQTFQDFEIILVDDATPDNSFALCQKLYGGNDKFKFIRHGKNRGLGEALNTGVKHATGKYLSFVDSDDFIRPNALETFYKAAEKTNAQVVHAAGWYELNETDENSLRQVWNQYTQEGFLPFDIVYRLEKHWKDYITWSMTWLSFCRRDFWQKKKISVLDIIAQDETLNFTLFCYAERYYILRESLYIYRRHKEQITRTNSPDKLAKVIRSIIVGSIYLKKLLDRIPKFKGYEQWREGLLGTFCYRLIVTHIAYYYRDCVPTSNEKEIVEKTLERFFADTTPFVRFLFDGFNFYRRQNQLLLKELKKNI